MASDGPDRFVCNAAWIRTPGRTDAVDVVADEFERPPALWTTPSAPVERPVTPAAGRWPRASRGWRSLGLLHARGSEERLHS